MFGFLRLILTVQICFVSFSVGGLVAFYAERKLHTLVAKVGSQLPMAQYRNVRQYVSVCTVGSNDTQMSNFDTFSIDHNKLK